MVLSLTRLSANDLVIFLGSSNNPGRLDSSSGTITTSTLNSQQTIPLPQNFDDTRYPAQHFLYFIFIFYFVGERGGNTMYVRYGVVMMDDDGWLCPLGYLMN